MAGGTGIRDYPAATTLQSDDALILSRIGVGTMQIPGSAFAGGSGGGGNDYDIGMFWPGDLDLSGALVFKFTAVRNVTIPVGFTGSFAFLEVSANNDGEGLNLSVTKDGEEIGVIQFEADSTVGEFFYYASGATVLTPGDSLLVYADAGNGAADLNITFKATK